MMNNLIRSSCFRLIAVMATLASLLAPRDRGWAAEGAATINDGIPAAWRIKYFGSENDPRAAAVADPDGDGLSNYQEYLGNTDPTRADAPSGRPVYLSTYAGGDLGAQDGFRTEARFNSMAVRQDRQGQIWICQSQWAGDQAGPGTQRVSVMDAHGDVATVAGAESAVVDGPLAQARFGGPSDIAFDSQGAAYVADRYAHRVRKIAAGLVSTFAGSTAGYRDGQGAAARFHLPQSIACDSSDHLYVAEWGNRCVRKIAPDGTVSTFAGQGIGPVDRNGVVAALQWVGELAVDKSDNLFLSDWSAGKLWRVTASGLASVFASGLASLESVSTDSDGNVYAYAAGNLTLNQWNASGALVWSLPSGGVEEYVDGPLPQARLGRSSNCVRLENGDLLTGSGPRLRRIHLTFPPLLSLDSPASPFTNTASLRFSTLLAQGQIHYTLDGREPSPQSPLYAGPVSLVASAVVKARLYVGEVAVSDTLTATLRRSGGAVDPADTRIAVRALPAAYQPGQALTVSLVVTPPTNATAYALEEQLPAGWIAGNTSDSGFFDLASRKLRFGPFLDRVKHVLTYEAWPPADGAGVARFSGFVSIDGQNVAIEGDSAIAVAQVHPADRQPADFRLSIGELTAYGAAWKRGDNWPTPPNPVPIEYVTRAAYLWKNGETYRFDAQSGSPPPLCWVTLAGQAALNVGIAFPANPTPAVQTLSLPGRRTTGALPAALAVMDGSYRPGQPVRIRLEVNPPLNTTVYALEDTLPKGWSVVGISDDGSIDPGVSKVKWGPFFDASPRAFYYQAVPPSGASQAAYFTGAASFDGGDVPVGGRRLIAPASLPSVRLVTDPDGAPCLELAMNAPVGAVVQVEYSGDLRLWQPLLTATNLTGAIRIREDSLPRGSAGFLRLVPAE